MALSVEDPTQELYRGPAPHPLLPPKLPRGGGAAPGAPPVSRAPVPGCRAPAAPARRTPAEDTTCVIELQPIKQPDVPEIRFCQSIPLRIKWSHWRKSLRPFCCHTTSKWLNDLLERFPLCAGWTWLTFTMYRNPYAHLPKSKFKPNFSLPTGNL